MKETKEDRTSTKKDIKTTVADNVGSRNRPDSIFVPQNQWSVEIARRGDTNAFNNFKKMKT